MSKINELRKSISKQIIGKPQVIDQALISLLAGGHLLIEDVPGVGKTTLAVSLAKSIHGDFQRIQFTSDLLPTDVLGVTLYNSSTREFEFKPGPVFTNILLADEINRTTPKTQSALLEAMQDGAVTVDRQTHPLPSPFMVIATQNPIEFHGTYPLPESQLDRFLMRIQMGYPTRESEQNILQSKVGAMAISTESVVSQTEIIEMQKKVSQVRVDPKLSDYMLKIIEKTRSHPDIELGVSTRGALAYFRAVQAAAFLSDRDFATPDDCKMMAEPVLTHRLIVSGRRSALSESKDVRTHASLILRDLLASTEIPV